MDDGFSAMINPDGGGGPPSERIQNIDGESRSVRRIFDGKAASISVDHERKAGVWTRVT